MKFRKLSILGLSLGFILVLGGVAFAEDKVSIVTIRTNEILRNYPPFLEAQQEFQAEQQAMQQRLQEMDEDERQMGQQIIQQQLQQTGARLEEEATQKLEADISQIAEEKGYDYVLDNNVMFAGAKDVTDEILEGLDIEEETPVQPEGTPQQMPIQID